MTMLFIPFSHALAVLTYLYAIQTTYAAPSTTTSTILSTTIVSTSTTTITLGTSSFASTTTLSSAGRAQATLVMSSGSGSGSGSVTGAYAGQSFEDAVLNSTNFYRKAYQAAPVTWDDGLASYAQRYAGGCVWEHSGGPHGENLALNYATPTLAIDSWAGEESKYNFGRGKFGEKTGHFTQLVWQNTRRVGCGAVKCDTDDVKGWYLVCEYDPPGNVVGSFKENVEKAGDDNGQLGMGGVGVSGVSRVLVLLVGVSALAGICL